VEASTSHMAAMRSLWLSSLDRAKGVPAVRLPELKNHTNGPVKATTGLGLPLCRGFATASGGWLALDESLNDGMTHFWCVLRSTETPTTSSPRFDWRSSQTVKTGSKSFFGGGVSKRSSRPLPFVPSQCDCFALMVCVCRGEVMAVGVCLVRTDCLVSLWWRNRAVPRPPHPQSRCSVRQLLWKTRLSARPWGLLCSMKSPRPLWKSRRPAPLPLT
jgi:hypothetical protein